MERLVLSKLLEWKNSEYRKPLLLKGVRGVGKTWLLKEFGNRYYQNIAYFNFEESPEYKQFFETTKEAHRILDNLIMASGQNIEKTRSSLLVHYLEVLHDTMPLVAFYENVKNLLSKTLQSFLQCLLKKSKNMATMFISKF